MCVCVCVCGGGGGGGGGLVVLFIRNSFDFARAKYFPVPNRTN